MLIHLIELLLTVIMNFIAITMNHYHVLKTINEIKQPIFNNYGLIKNSAF